MAVKGNPFAVVFLLCFACHFFFFFLGKHSGTAKAEEKAGYIDPTPDPSMRIQIPADPDAKDQRGDQGEPELCQHCQVFYQL